MSGQDLTPWNWDVQRMCGDVMELIAQNCENCASYMARKRTVCSYIVGYFAGKYPTAPPPADWYVNAAGVPVCTARRKLEHRAADAIPVANRPGATPTPPEPELVQHREVLVLDKKNNKLFFADEAEQKKFNGWDFVVRPSKNKVLEILHATIYRPI